MRFHTSCSIPSVSAKIQDKMPVPAGIFVLPIIPPPIKPKSACSQPRFLLENLGQFQKIPFSFPFSSTHSFLKLPTFVFPDIGCMPSVKSQSRPDLGIVQDRVVRLKPIVLGSSATRSNRGWPSADCAQADPAGKGHDCASGTVGAGRLELCRSLARSGAN